MKRILLFLALFPALLFAAPPDKTLNLPIYESASSSLVGRAFTVSGNNGKVLGVSAGDWALITPSGLGDFLANGSVPMTGALTFSGTTHPGIRLNSLTTTQRDAMTPLFGYLVANSTNTAVEWYNGSAWTGIGGGGSFDATTVDAVTWSDGANASNIWTFNLSGTDPAITFASGAVNVSTGALQVAGVAVPTISSTSTLTNKRITQRVETLTDAATVTINIDNADCGTLATLSQTTTFGAPTGTPTAFQVYKMSVTSSTARTISFNAAFDDSDDMPFPTATSGGGKTDLFTFMYDPTKTKWCLAGKNFGF